ncbi:MAG: M14 family metallopeptidase [Candidatus Eisenbacteria bacterium]
MTDRLRFRSATALAAVVLATAAGFALANAAAPAAPTAAAPADSVRRYQPGRALADSIRRPADMPPRPAVRPRGIEADPKPAGPAIPVDLPNFWRTRAERTLWKQTADYDETMRYCRQLEAGSRWVKVVTFGKSGQGRDLVLLVCSKDRAFTPEAARATGKPVVLVQNGIHAGEIEGKDASLALVRDMAVLRGPKQALLDSVIVLVVPILSTDGHERKSRYNRINQNGPEEMGWRHNAAGLNLNRDYVKTESPEMHALIANVYTKWWPDLLVDDHTTDGADYQHDVTYAFQNAPLSPEPIARWCVETIEGRVVPRLSAMGHLPAPYLSFRGRPENGIEWGATPPRFSTGYAPLQCRAALLVETHMLKPYGDRVQATYDLLYALLDEIGRRPRALTDAVEAAEAAAVARGRETTPARRTVVLDARLTERAVPFAYRGKRSTEEPSPITGTTVTRYTQAPWDTTLSLYRELAPSYTTTLPAGYVVPQEWTRAVQALDTHGLKYRRFAREWRDTVELARVTAYTMAPESYENHHVVRMGGVKIERQLRRYRAGDLWVPVDQPGAALVAQLFEPQAADGLLAWNAFDTIFQKKEYAESYVMEPIARDMLAKDPRLAKEFADRLAADSTFAKNPFARVDFFYRRSPWADPEQDLVPVARALRVPPATVFEAPTR